MQALFHISILGGGAVGHMLASCLQAKTSHKVQILGRMGPLAKTVPIYFGDQLHPIRIETEYAQPDLVLVAVKSYQLQEALAQHLPQLQAGAVLVLLPNGYIEPLIAPFRGQYPDLIWRKGVVTRGIRADAEGNYRVGLQGQVMWGGATPATLVEQSCLDALQDLGWAWHESSCDLRRNKWFFNSVLNSLCAAYRLPRNGDALQLFAADLEALAREAHALGQELWPDWDYSWDFLWWELRKLIQMTADNENSMARDRRLARRTEADVLSGCVFLSQNPERYPLMKDFHQRISAPLT